MCNRSTWVCFSRWGVLTWALVGAASVSAGPVFSDSTLSLALFSSTPSYTSPGLSLTNSNGGGMLQTATPSMTGQASYGFVAGFVYAGFVYDPGSSGAINNIDFQIDRAATTTYGGIDVPVSGLTGRALIQQAGRLYQYIGPLTAFNPYPTLTTLTSNGLVAADFGEWDTATNAVNFGSNPNFGGGGSMNFGFATRIGPTNPADPAIPVTMTTLAANFRLAINPAAAVPVPSSVALVLAGLLAVAATRRHRARTRP